MVQWHQTSQMQLDALMVLHARNKIFYRGLCHYYIVFYEQKLQFS
jgi:hypothetical protein